MGLSEGKIIFGGENDMLISSIMNPAFFVILILCVALVLFMTEAIPITATAVFVSLSLYLGGVIDAKIALKSLSGQNVMIIAALGIVGEALFKTGAAGRIGTFFESIAKSEKILVFWLVMGSGILAAFLSVNGCAALLISLALGISQSTSYRRCKMMYPIAVGVCLGGGITTVGSSSTLYLQNVLSEMGIAMKFFELAPISIILLFVSALFLATIGFKLMPEQANNEGEFSYNEKKADFSKVPAWKPKLAIFVLLATFVAMYFADTLKVGVGMVALLAAFIVVVAKLVTSKEAMKAIPMSAIVMYSFMVPISDAMKISGASKMLANFLQANAGEVTSPLLVILCIYAIAVPLTNIMSNAATIIMLTPVSLAVAQSLNLNPLAILMTVRMAGTIAFLTPIGFTPNTMAIEPGGYSFKDYLRPGIPLTIINIVISIVYFYFVYPMFAS